MSDQVIRLFLAVAMAAGGVAALFMPNFFGDVTGYFTRTERGLPWMDKQRLRNVIAARKEIEVVPQSYVRFYCAAALALAALELWPVLPYVLPYAALCVLTAFGMLGVYLRFRQRWKVHVAPLVRRSPLEALPIGVLAAMLWCLLITLALAAVPAERVSAIAVAAAMIVLAIVAWRVAVAPTLLFGDDPEWEYVVDERIRIGRARAIAVLGCLLAYLFVVLAAPSIRYPYAEWAPLAVNVPVLAVMFTQLVLQWQRVRAT